MQNTFRRGLSAIVLSLMLVGCGASSNIQNRENLARNLRNLGNYGNPVSKNINHKENNLYEITTCFMEKKNKDVLGYKTDLIFEKEIIPSLIKKAEKNQINHEGNLKILDIGERTYDSKGGFCITKLKEAWLE